MTDFNGNTSKTWLKQARIALTQRINRARQQLELLKNNAAWRALLKPDRLEPDRLRPPRRCHAGGMTLRNVLLGTLIGTALLTGLVWLIITALQKIL